MLSKHDSKLKLAVFISILLHVILIGFLVIGAMTRVNQITGEIGGEKIDAIMVDPNAMAQQFDRQQQQKIESERAEYLRKEQAAQQAKELQQKQQQQQQRLKQLEKERLDAEEKTRKANEQKALQEAEARKAKAEAERQQQLALEAQKKAEAEAAQRAAKEKELAEKQAAKEKAEAEKKRQLAAEEKRKAEEAKRRESELKDLFGGLASPTNAPTTSSSSGSGKQSGATGAEVDSYQSQIKVAIENKFKDPQLYRGKECVLRIKLAPDGLVIDVQAVEGDPVLCREAISATRMANIPKPPNKSVYEIFKDAFTITFNPE